MSAFYYKEYVENKNFVSPLPEFLNKKNNSEVSSLDFWFPSLFGFFEPDGVPRLSAKSVLVYDLTDEKVIYEKTIWAILYNEF